MRILKIAAWAVSALVALIVLALVLVVIFVDPNDYRDDIEQLVERQTGRNLQLSGELQLKVFPWIALRTGEASLGDAPGFDDEPFVSIQEAQISVRFWPLLRGQVEAGKVRIVGARVRLITDAEGRNNWDEFGRKDAAAVPSQPAGEMQMPTLSGVEIVDATLVQENRQTDTRRVFSDFNLATGRIAAGEPFDLKTDFQYQHSPDLQVLARIAAEITADPSTQQYALAEPAIDLTMRGPAYPEEGMQVRIKADQIRSHLGQRSHQLQAFVLSTTWKAKDARAPGLPIELQAQELTADLAAQTLHLGGLSLQLAQTRLKGSLQGEQIIDAPHLTGTLQMPPTSLKQLLTQVGVSLPVARDPKAYESLSFEGRIDVTRTSAGIEDAVLKLDDTTARGSVAIADFESKALRFDLNVDRIDADRYRAPEPPEAAPEQARTEGARGDPETSTPVPIPLEMLRTLNMRGQLKVGEAIFAGMKFSQLQLGVNANNGRLRLHPLAAQAYEGRYEGDIGVDATGDVARITMDEHVKGVNFAPLLRDGFETTRISGKGNAELKITASGRTTDDLLHSLDGTMKFAVDQGALEGADLWYEIRRARAVLKRQPIPARSGPARTEFKTLQGSGVFADGVLSNKDLQAALDYLRIEGQGTVNLPQKTLDYRLNAIVLKMPREGADTAQMQDMVDATIPVRVTGTFADPKVRPDLEGYVKEQVKQRVEEEKKKVEEKVRDKVQDKLKDIFGR